MKKTIKPKIKTHLSTDSITEVIQGLKEVSEKLEKVLEDSYQWKWVIFALDNSVQNTMTFTVRDSAGINILRPHLRRKMAKSQRDGSLSPQAKLDEFLSLYEATKFLSSKKYVPKGTEEESITKIHEIRCKFQHFIPQDLKIFLDNYPDKVMDCIEFIRFLLFDSFNFFSLLNKAQERKIKSYIFRIKKSCKNINQIYIPLIRAEKKHS